MLVSNCVPIIENMPNEGKKLLGRLYVAWLPWSSGTAYKLSTKLVGHLRHHSSKCFCFDECGESTLVRNISLSIFGVYVEGV